MSTDEAFLELLAKALAAVKLEAIVVGMAGAALRGAPVLTQDVDLLLRDTPLNHTKLRALAKAIGAAEKPIVRELSDVQTIVGASAPVDAIFETLPGRLTFAAVRSRSDRIRIGQSYLRVAALRDIIKSKRAAGRPKDIAVLPVLEAALKLSGKLK